MMLRLSLRDLRAHAGRYVLTFLAVIIGVGFVAGVITLTDTISRTLDDLYAGLHAGTDVAVRGEAQFELGPEFGGGVQRSRIAATLADVVADLDGVSAAEGYLQGYARPIEPDGTPFGNPTFGVPTIGTNWGVVDELNPFQIVEGRAPEHAGEVVFDKRTVDQTGYRVGDTATVETASGTTTAELVGVARFGNTDSPGGAAITLFDNETAQGLLAQPGQVDTIAVVAEDGTSPDALRATVAEALSTRAVEVVTGDEMIAEQQDSAQSTFSGVRTFLLVFAVISVLVGTFVIYTSFSFIVAQRQRQVALLRAVGAGRGQVLTSIVLESLAVGLVASLVGYAAGVVLARVLAQLFVPGSDTAVLPSSLAISLGVGTVVTVVSAVFPAARAARVPPVAAMRDVAVDRSHRSVWRAVLAVLLGVPGAVALVAAIAGREVGGLSPLQLAGAGMGCLFLALIAGGPLAARPASLGVGTPLRRLRGIVGRLAQQNAARNPTRTASTASALMIGLGIVSLFLVVNASLRASLDRTIDDRFHGDLVVDAGTGPVGGGVPSTVADRIAALPEVDTVSGLRFGFAEVDGTAAPVGGLDPGAAFDLFDVQVTSGDPADLGADGIAVFAGTADDKGWAVGDDIPVVFGDASVRTFEIAMIFDSKDLTGAYVMSTDAFDRLQPDVGDSQIWIRTADGVPVEQARAAIDPLLASYPSAELQDLAEFKESTKAQYDIILLLVNALLVLTIVIAMIGIVNTLILSVVERTREIGLTRAVGASRAQVRATIRWEALLISAFGLAAALGVGVLFGWVLVRLLADEGFSVFALPADQLAVFTAVTAALTLTAAALPAAWAGRRRILTAVVDH